MQADSKEFKKATKDLSEEDRALAGTILKALNSEEVIEISVIESTNTHLDGTQIDEQSKDVRYVTHNENLDKIMTVLGDKKSTDSDKASAINKGLGDDGAEFFPNENKDERNVKGILLIRKDENAESVYGAEKGSSESNDDVNKKISEGIQKIEE